MSELKKIEDLQDELKTSANRNTELSIALTEVKADMAKLQHAVVQILTLMGITDPATGLIKEEIANGEESFIPGLLKSLGDLVTLLTKAGMPDWMGGGKAKEALKDKFSFIAPLLPLIKKYHQK